MMETDPSAAEEKGGLTNPATPGDDPPPPTDEELRRFAAGRLADHLQIGVDLAQRCELLSLKAKGDKLGPLYAAARLMQANARVAEALANVAQVERRRRSIHERIQAPDPKQAELNSSLQKEKITAEERLKIWNRMNEHVEQSIRARMGEEGADDSVSRLIREEEKNLARLRGEDVDDDDEA
jgi:hypothetical protein